jgi:hypothetical protein
MREGYRRSRGYQIFIMFAIHRQHRHIHRRNFVPEKDTRLSDIYDSYLGERQAKQGYQIFIMLAIHTQATQTRILEEFRTFKGYKAIRHLNVKPAPLPSTAAVLFLSSNPRKSQYGKKIRDSVTATLSSTMQLKVALSNLIVS